jgi:hypothetical protein
MPATSHHGTPYTPGPQLTLAQAQAELGVPVALLASPDFNPDVGVFGEETTGPGRRTRRNVVEVQITYPGSGLTLVTFRLDGGLPVAQVSWQVMVNYRLSAAGSTGVPWETGPPPEDMVAELDVNAPPETDELFQVTVDGTTHTWYGFTRPAFTTGIPLVACGGIIADAIVAAAGPRDIMDGLSVLSWPIPG